MKIIISNRGAGKTYKIVEWLKEGSVVTWWPYVDRVMLVSNYVMGEQIIKQYDLKKNQVMSWDEWRNGAVGRRTQPEVMVDNGELFLQHMLGSYANLVGMSITGEVELLHGGTQDD